MQNSVCVFLIILGIFGENQPALTKNCYSSLVGPAKTCNDIFYNEKYTNIDVEELKLLKSKHFHCFKESLPGETRCKAPSSDKCLRATLRFEDDSESVFLGCDSKNNSICKKLMTEMNFPEQFGKKLDRKLSVCQHCYEDLCNMKSGIRRVTKKFLNKDVLAIIKRDADEKSTTKAVHPKTSPTGEDIHTTLPPAEGGERIPGEAPPRPGEGPPRTGDDQPPGQGPKEENEQEETSTAKSATKESEPEKTEFKCYQSDADHCQSYEGSIKAYNCIRSAKVEQKNGCAVCVTATVIAKDKDTFQLALCEADSIGTQCKHFNSDWSAEGEYTLGKGIKEVKCDQCKRDLCNKVTPKSQSTKYELPNLLILILAGIFLTLI